MSIKFIIKLELLIKAGRFCMSLSLQRRNLYDVLYKWTHPNVNVHLYVCYSYSEPRESQIS